jgi:hypothetical protein
MKSTNQILARSIAILALSSTPFLSTSAQAADVSPKGVNVKSFGPTTVFLTYSGLNNQTPGDAFWCGQINADQSCVSSTLFGRLPSRYNLGRSSGQNNYTDIMTIPTSVSRKAYQAALRNNNSEFFYVRRWRSTNGGPDEFVAVTCRLSSGGARVPFSITSVKLQIGANKAAPAIFTGATLPQFGAQISYNGTGRLKGRWEVVLPGDPLPTQRDLLTEASLPLEERGLQRRYQELERFDLFLQPTGQVLLPGPDPAKFPTGLTGTYQILLRIEATDDKEGDSSIGTGIVNSGGVAGFPMPVFRYVMTANPNRLTLISPLSNSQIAIGQPIRFSWVKIGSARGYKLVIKDGERVILSALLEADRTTYNAPPWLKQNTKKFLTWQIQALNGDGSVLTESVDRQFQILGK